MIAGVKHKIIVEASSGPVRWFELSKSSFCVGSGESNEVRVQGQGASVAPAHVKVDYRAGVLWVTDLGSATGTFVDNAKLPTGKPHGLPGSGQMRLGPDLTLALRIERTKSRLPRVRRGGDGGDERTSMVNKLESAVFKRRTQEVGNVVELAEERRNKPRRKRRAKHDEFGRKAQSGSEASESGRSRSRSYSGGREKAGEKAEDHEKARDRPPEQGEQDRRARTREKTEKKSKKKEKKEKRSKRRRSTSSSRFITHNV
jgi:predicted component of type VI protein secretion system